jgi:GR25 family glycosyltransferase involved in LPS biosynthesis
LNLFFSYDLTPSKAYIIRVVGHEDSEKKAAHCAESCDNVGQEWEYWDAYNGIDGELKAPSHHNPIMDCIKITDHYMTRGEVACALSHISLWAKCVVDDKPLVVLEHDSVMTQPYTQHAVYNSIAT